MGIFVFTVLIKENKRKALVVVEKGVAKNFELEVQNNKKASGTLKGLPACFATLVLIKKILFNFLGVTRIEVIHLIEVNFILGLGVEI